MSDDDRRNDSDEEGEDLGFDSAHDDDDSEEEEDDEEEIKKVADGFIVDDDDEDEDEDEEVVRRVSRKKKRRKEIIEEDLDDEDLDLMEENTGVKIKRPEKFKRLKRRRQEDEDEPGSGNKQHSLQSIFDDPEIEEDADDGRGDYEDEMDRFIDDEDDEEDGIDDRRDRREKAPMKPRARVAPIEGMNEEAWAEWYEVFGDGEDYAYALGKENGEEAYYEPKPEPRLKDVFEPGVLSEKLMTDVDEIIRVKDIPERMQLRSGVEPDRELTADEIEDEATWITKQLNTHRGAIDQAPFAITNVTSVLQFMSVEFMEVPFIETHRRDYFTKVEGQQLTQLLKREDLWYIYDLDLQFRSFLERREAIRALMDRLGMNDSYAKDSLLFAETVDDLGDISDYINLRYSKEIDKAKAFKRPGAGGAYDLAKRNHLEAYIKDFGLSAREFGTNVKEGNKRHFPDDVQLAPRDAAERYIGAGFHSAERVEMAAVNMIAMEVSVDPQVRSAIRSKYETSACVTVAPTDLGMTAIDEVHPYYPFKRLTQKSVKDFHDGQFLQILQAQSEGLVTVNVRIHDEENYLLQISDYFLSDNYSEQAQIWNDLRRKILRLALKETMFPAMERWIKSKLRSQAEEWIARKCQLNLEEKLNVAPFASRSMKGDRMPPRVVAISHGPGTAKDATQIAYVDSTGKFSDHLKVDALNALSAQKALEDFLDKNRPDVVVVGGFSVVARRLYDNVDKVVSAVRDSRGDDVTVIWANDEAARLYYNSSRAAEEYPDANPLTRYCISLARLVQSPMNEYASLGTDLMSIRYHPLQQLVNQDRLRELLDRALINIINSVGLDINLVVGSPYKAHMLKYICGLGPRKAQSLVKNIESDDHNGTSLDKRGDLVIRKLLTWKIFMNCCSFLRVRTNMNGDILDDTRIHSEDYNLARKMAADALEIDEEGLEEYDNASQHVEELMKDDGAEKLNDLLLEDYAHQLEKIQHKPKRMTLETIKVELQHPFRDPRRPFERPSASEVFSMLTGETDQSLKEGYIVPAQVSKVKDRLAICRLDSGVDAMLHIQNISDSKVGSPSDVLHEGQTIQVKVLRLDKEKFFAEVSCKESDIRQGDLEVRMLPRDRMFDQYEEERVKNEKSVKVKKNTFMARKVNHPLFQNLNAEAAVAYLESRPVGELVVRPSARGIDHLSITTKLAKGLYRHYDVLELDKKDDYSLGKTLKIDNFKYSDLDELLVSHVEAIMSKIESVIASPKYKENASDLKLSLETQTKAKPGAAVYGFTLDHRYPGYITLMFKLGAARSVEEWSVKVFPEHYSLKGPTKKDCKDVTALTNAFKEMMAQRNRPKPAAPGPAPARSTLHGPPHQAVNNYGSHHHYGSHHQPPPHMMHQPQAMQAMQAAPWGTPWGSGQWAGAPHMGPGGGGHMTGPGGAHGARSSRAPPTPRRHMPGQHPHY